MTEYQPSEYSAIDERDYPQLPSGFVKWACVSAGIDDPDEVDTDRIADVAAQLSSLNLMATMEPASPTVWQNLLRLERPDLFGPVSDDDLPEILATRPGQEAVRRAFLAGSILYSLPTPAHLAHAAESLRRVPIDRRLEVYRRHGFPDWLIRQVERVPDAVPWPERFALLRAVAPDLAARCASGQAIAEGALSDQTRALLESDAYLAFAPDSLEQFLEQGPLSRLLTLLSHACAAVASPRENVLPIALVLGADDPASAFVRQVVDPALLARTLTAMIVARLQRRDPADVPALAEWLWEAQSGQRVLEVSQSFDYQLGETIADYLEEEQPLAELARWSRGLLQGARPIRLSGELSQTVFIRLAQALGTEPGHETLAILGIACLEPGFGWWEQTDNRSLLRPVLSWARENGEQLATLLTLGVSEWGDENDRRLWEEVVISEWLALECDLAGLSPGDERVAPLVVLYVASPTFRARLAILKSVEYLAERWPAPILTQVVETANRRSVATKTDDPWIRVLNVAIAMEDPSPERVYEELRSRGETNSIPSEVWNELGVATERVRGSSLAEQVERLWPNVGLAVDRWESRQRTGLGRSLDTDVVVRMLSEDADVVPRAREMVRVALAARLPRDAALAEDGLAEVVKPLSAFALERLRDFRRFVGSSDGEAQGWCSVAPNLATVARFVADDWKVLKALLLAFRALPQPGCDASLKPLRDEGVHERLIAWTIDRLLRETDQYQELRRQWALDIIARLKPFKGDPAERSLAPAVGDDLVSPAINEPSATWRTGYVRALGDLGVMQTGKGHSNAGVLKKVSASDPAMPVRIAAERVLEELSRMRSGWSHGSHRRLLFHAWWWIRRAQRLALNVTVHDEEANRVRNTEFR